MLKNPKICYLETDFPSKKENYDELLTTTYILS
jgi:hypothetical protein